MFGSFAFVFKTHFQFLIIVLNTFITVIIEKQAISPFNDNRRISIFQLNPKQVGRKTKVCYPGYNRYDNETENFIERYLGKNG